MAAVITFSQTEHSTVLSEFEFAGDLELEFEFAGDLELEFAAVGAVDAALSLLDANRRGFWLEPCWRLEPEPEPCC